MRNALPLPTDKTRKRQKDVSWSIAKCPGVARSTEEAEPRSQDEAPGLTTPNGVAVGRG